MERFTKHHESWNAFVDYVNEPAPPDLAYKRTSDPSDWNGNVTFGQATEYAHRGWAEAAPDADRLAHGITKQVIANREATEWAFPRDVAGDVFDIGAYLSGAPECFIQPMPFTTVSPARVVRIIVSTGALSHVQPTAIRNRGIAVVALIECIRRAGYSVELWAWAAATGDDWSTGKKVSGRQSHAVCVQPANQPVNVGRIMWAFAHPGMHRRLMFAARHHAEVPAVLRWDGYGGTVKTAPDPGDLPEGVCDDDTVVITSINPGEDWNTDDAVRFIEETLDRITK